MKKEEKQEQFVSPDISMVGGLWDFVLPIVEFLGILVPGIVFLTAVFPAIVIPGMALVQFLKTPDTVVPLVTENVLDAVSSSTFVITGVLLVFAYVTGHLFFRRDPKIPDEYSFKKARLTIGEEGPVRLSEAEKQHNKEHGEPDEYNLEFPYRYLHEYLFDRGLSHLAEMIPWKGNKPETYPRRTKHFMNLLKVRLEFLYPRQYTRLQRNEAHVRLMSSIWYVARSLSKTSIAGLLIAIFVVVFVALEKDSWWPLPYGYVLVAPLAVLVVSALGRGEVEKFLHYQRIREIVFILEAAHFANRIVPDLDILSPLGQPDEHNEGNYAQPG